MDSVIHAVIDSDYSGDRESIMGKDDINFVMMNMTRAIIAVIKAAKGTLVINRKDYMGVTNKEGAKMGCDQDGNIVLKYIDGVEK